jgi:hypothetical protein
MFVCGILGRGHPPEAFHWRWGEGSRWRLAGPYTSRVAVEIQRIDILFVGLVFVTIVLDNVHSTGTFMYCIWRSLWNRRPVCCFSHSGVGFCMWH